ncbi:hypothetical protein B0H67DRAFT_597675 [Lasiosphaeris hirsuta]|uniref:HD/PDEase domain-containing protein n=1 Tax=Lasiosphaeris hirsuta TaxID=260670 RepID=A0AA40BCS5_9PEZI|nr:hypothetical protein B0H67DRAFT_597675 [Lasiosphaeris hirsuta]
MCKGRPSDTADTGVGTGAIPAAVQALVPAHPACAEALTLAKASLPASILYHSFRVYLYAHAFTRLFHSDPDPDPDQGGLSTDPGGDLSGDAPAVLFVACILHDMGAAAQHDAVPERFEVVGADVAARLLRAHGVAEGAARAAWLAIALHTSPGIAERLAGAPRAVRLAVRADFGSYPAPRPDALPGGPGTVDMIRWKLPQLEIEKDLGDAVVRQALLDPLKAPQASWPGDLVRAKRAEPGWEGVNKGF